MADSETQGHEAHRVMKSATMKFVDLFVDYLIPIGTFFLGLFTGPDTWGGVNALSNALTSSGTGMADKAPLIGAGLYGGIFAITGGAFWKLSHEDGRIYKGVGRAFGAYFFGTAIGYVVLAATSKPANDGLIDEIVAAFKGL